MKLLIKIRLSMIKYLMIFYTVFCVLFTGINVHLFSLPTFNSKHFTAANIYFTYESIKKNPKQ